MALVWGSILPILQTLRTQQVVFLTFFRNLFAFFMSSKLNPRNEIWFQKSIFDNSESLLTRILKAWNRVDIQPPKIVNFFRDKNHHRQRILKKKLFLQRSIYWQEQPNGFWNSKTRNLGPERKHLKQKKSILHCSYLRLHAFQKTQLLQHIFSSGGTQKQIRAIRDTLSC